MDIGGFDMDLIPRLGPYQTFSLNLAYPGRNREVKQQIVEMTLNGSGVRDIARVLQISTSTVMRELKKTRAPSSQSIKSY